MPSSAARSWTVLAVLGAAVALTVWVVGSADPAGGGAVDEGGARPSGPSAPTGADVAAPSGPRPAAVAGEEAEPGSVTAASSRERTEAVRVHGRCVEAGTRRPVPGVTVSLKVYGHDFVERLTDEAGAFEFPSPGYRVSWIEVRRPSEWIYDKPRLRLSPQQRTGVQEVLLELAPSGSGEGRVVDAATGEPVPEVEVRVSEAGRERRGGAGGQGYSDRAVTDDDGHFRSQGMVRRGPLTFRVMEQGRRLQVRRGAAETSQGSWDPEHDGPLEIPVDVGPTYQVRCTADEEYTAHRLRVSLAERVPGRARDWDWHRLRSGEPPWVRLPEPVNRWKGSELWLRARVYSTDLYGEARVRSAVGRHDDVVTIHLAPSATVAGRVVDASGVPVAEALVHAAPASDPVRRRTVSTSRSGRFEIDQLSLGATALVVRAGAFPALERELVLPRGRTDVGELVLGGEVPVGGLSGTLSYDAASGPLRCVVELRSLSPGGPVLAVEPSESPSTPFPTEGDEARFHFDHVPPGAYEVRVVALDAHAWSPAVLRAAPPSADLEFVRAPPGPRSTIAFRPRDARSGKPIRRFRVRWSMNGTWYPESFSGQWDWKVGPFAPDTSLSWSLYAEGYRPAFGEEASFPAGQVRTVDVSLERGWGARLHLRDATGFHATFSDDTWTYQGAALSRPPVVGAVVWADGVRVGESDALGRVDVALARAPERISIEAPGWRQVESDFFRDGKIARDLREVLVWFERH